jgi:hypothetical protein
MDETTMTTEQMYSEQLHQAMNLIETQANQIAALQQKVARLEGDLADFRGFEYE